MDEPYGALDPIIRAKAQDDLLAIQKHFGTTIVLVTHDMNEAFHLADKIAVMDKGRVLQYGPPEELVRSPATPFVETLIGDTERPFRLLAIAKAGAAAEPGEGGRRADPRGQDPAGSTCRFALDRSLGAPRDFPQVVCRWGALRLRLC